MTSWRNTTIEDLQKQGLRVKAGAPGPERPAPMSPRSRASRASGSGVSPPQRLLGAWLHDAFPHVFRENYRPKCTDTDGKVRQYEIDFADPVTKLGIEVDGYRDHGSRKGWARDRQKDMLHTEHGWHIIRVTPKQVYDEMPRIVAWVAAHLAGERSGSNVWSPSLNSRGHHTDK